jgi:hypothetical protein
VSVIGTVLITAVRKSRADASSDSSRFRSEVSTSTVNERGIRPAASCSPIADSNTGTTVPSLRSSSYSTFRTEPVARKRGITTSFASRQDASVRNSTAYRPMTSARV